jgi:hypothetical protein
MTDFKFTGPRFNPSSLSVSGVVTASVISKQSVPSVSSSTISNVSDVDIENLLLAVVVVGVCGYMLYQHLEARDRNRLYVY